MKRPKLHEVSIPQGWFKAGTLTITMSEGQWDRFLQASYDMGALLLELDKNEKPIKAYQRILQ